MSSNSSRSKLNDIIMAKRLQDAISSISLVMSYAENANKHPAFVQANLQDAHQDLLDVQNNWDVEPTHPHEFDLESRGIDEAKIE